MSFTDFELGELREEYAALLKERDPDHPLLRFLSREVSQEVWEEARDRFWDGRKGRWTDFSAENVRQRVYTALIDKAQEELNRFKNLQIQGLEELLSQ